MLGAEITTIICDMDGVLLDTEKLSRSTFEQACAEFEYEVDEALFTNLTGRNASTQQDMLREVYGKPGIDFDQRWKDIYRTRLSAHVPVMPGAMKFLDIVQSAGYNLAVGTSSITDKAETYLQAAGLARYFSLIAGSDLVKKAKPEPDIYHYVMAHLGVQPKHTIIIEDSENGVKAALATGAQVVQIHNIYLLQPADNARQTSHFTFSSMDALADAVAALLLSR